MVSQGNKYDSQEELLDDWTDCVSGMEGIVRLMISRCACSEYGNRIDQSATAECRSERVPTSEARASCLITVRDVSHYRTEAALDVGRTDSAIIQEGRKAAIRVAMSPESS